MGLCLPGSLTVGEEKSEFSEVWLSFKAFNLAA